MGLALMVVIWLITFISTYFFIAKTWWFPAGVAAAAPAIDRQFTVTFIAMGVIFVLAQCSLGYLAWRYRDRGAASEKVKYSHGNVKLEILWTDSDGHPIHWLELDGQQHLGGGAL